MGLSALLIEPELQSRQKFQEIAQSHNSFERVSASSTLNEGADRLRRGRHCDVVYVSTRFDPVFISSFISQSRSYDSSKLSPHLLVLARDQRNISTRHYEIAKPDGYMLEPVVREDLNGSVSFIENFQSKKLEKSVKPEMLAKDIKLLCARVSVALDRGKAGLRDLKELTRKVENLEGEALAMYYEELISSFGELPAPLRELTPGLKK